MAMYIKSVFSLLLSMLIIASSKAQQPLTVGTSIAFPSKILKEERQLNIYLPRDYQENDTTSYPVIYIPDGGWDEDFLHLVGLIHFNSLPWVERIPPSIVVGIGGNQRRRDFTSAVDNLQFVEDEGLSKDAFPQYGGLLPYLDFIEKELQPFIHHTFRTNESATVIGESLAGFLLTEILCQRPYLFDHYVIISPSLWWANRSLLKNADNLLKQNLNQPVQVYLGIPNREEEVRMYEDAMQLAAILKRHSSIQFVFDYLPEETHATVLYQAVYNAFKKLSFQAKPE